MKADFHQVSVVEKLSFLLLVIPFASLTLGILSEIFFGDQYFFLVSISGFLFLPTGIFALLIQLFRIAKKRPANLLNTLILIISVITTVVGVIACMAIYVIVG